MLALIIPNDSNLDVVKHKARKSFYHYCHNLFKQGIYRTPLKSLVISLLSLDFCLLSFLGRSGSAVGLSAISFSAPLQKDAASIPNALFNHE